MLNTRIIPQKVVALCFVALISTGSVLAQEEKNQHLLDGTTIDWTYKSGAGMILTFEDGLARYEWVSGSPKGRSAKDIPYQSREISDGVFMLNWVQPKKQDFITLIFDFNQNTAFSSGLIGYGTEKQRNLFQDGVVNSVER